MKKDLLKYLNKENNNIEITNGEVIDGDLDSLLKYVLTYYYNTLMDYYNGITSEEVINQLIYPDQVVFSE